LKIEKYEATAKFFLPQNERELIEKKITEIVNGFGELEAIDTAGVEPLVTVLNVTNVLREDICAKNISLDELLSNAPEQYDGYFQIPKAL
jgi:aspartyl-tRNA(Asn)/glutamyl-tRNA(Gln) amidotransferase subunit C